MSLDMLESTQAKNPTVSHSSSNQAIRDSTLLLHSFDLISLFPLPSLIQHA